MPSLADKVVLIMGTATGRGAVLAETFAKAGATVVGCDVSADAGRRLPSGSGRPTLVLDGGFTAQ